MTKKTLVVVTALFVAAVMGWAAFAPQVTEASPTVGALKACYGPNVPKEKSGACVDKIIDASNTSDRGNKNAG